MDLFKQKSFCFLCIFFIAIFSLEAKKHYRDINDLYQLIKYEDGKSRSRQERAITGPGKAAEYCDKYSRQACRAPPPPSGARIVGGTKVNDNKFPHMATLGNPKTKDDVYCGASLISENYLLTAAHCLFNEEHQKETLEHVRMGDLNLRSNRDNDHVIVGKVIETIVHPWYRDNDNDDYFADLALIKIEPINFTDYVRPICLFLRDNVPNISLIITGWGQKKEIGEASVKLHYAEVYQLDFRLCQNGTYDDRTMMCAGLFGGGKDACGGDSGGPLQIKMRDYVDLVYVCGEIPLYYQVGIISNGEGCARPMLPTSYMRISYYIDWIADIVWQDSA